MLLQFGRHRIGHRLGLDGIRSSCNAGLLLFSRSPQSFSFSSSPPTSSSVLPASYPPTPKTTVILKDIGPHATQGSLDAVLTESELMPPAGTRKHGMPVRRGQVQPGIVMHLSSEIEAEHICDRLTREFNLETYVANTMAPSLLLQNLPANTLTQGLYENFKKHEPHKIYMYGASVLQAVFLQPLEALTAAKTLESDLLIDGEKVRVNTLKLPDGGCLVRVYDFPPGCDMEAASKAMSTVLGGEGKAPTVSVVRGSEKSLVMRVTPLVACDQATLKETVEQAVASTLADVGRSHLRVEVSGGCLRPALFLRKINHCKEGSLEDFLSELGSVKTQMVRDNNEVIKPDLAVSYFPSEELALKALRQLKNTSIDGKKINVNYKETSVPACEISGLPQNCHEETVRAIMRAVYLTPESVEVLHDGDSGSRAVVTFESPKLVNRAEMALRKTVRVGNDKYNLSATALDSSDLSVSLTGEVDALNDELAQKIESSLRSVQSVASVGVPRWTSNLSAVVTFQNLTQAYQAQDAVSSGAIGIGEGDVGVLAKVAGTPSYSLEVSGFSPEDPSSKLLDALAAEGLTDPISSSRSATIKFRRHRDVVPGMRKLRTLELEGQLMRPKRFEFLNTTGDSEYDVVGELEEWDRYNLEENLKDFMHADPATRYQVAKNQFERAFKDAMIYNDPSFLIDEDSPEHIKEEVRQILSPNAASLADKNSKIKKSDDFESVPRPRKYAAMGGDEKINRAFELFIQRQDLKKFAFDFDEVRSLLGPENPEDPFNWSEFRMEDTPSVLRLEAAMKEELDAMKVAAKHAMEGAGMEVSGGPLEKRVRKADKALKEEQEQLLKRRAREDALSEFPLAEHPEVEEELAALGIDKEDAILDEHGNLIDGSIEKEITVSDGEEEVVVSLENIDQLIDSEGRVWSGVILDTDNVQKTMPGGRMMSFRALVCVGNLRGAAGFGVGKGENAKVAINAAFRDALRNLLYIDLYDNQALAHDLYGKHNACHAYIRATPPSRLMVASPFVMAVLKRFGIASASVKIQGRRNPYSMIRAIFNALEKHENLDETARARGQRYLTLRWAYDNNL